MNNINKNIIKGFDTNVYNNISNNSKNLIALYINLLVWEKLWVRISGDITLYKTLIHKQ